MLLFLVSALLYVLAFFSSLSFYYLGLSRYIPSVLGLSAGSVYSVAVGVKTLEVGGFPFADVYGFSSFLGNLMALTLFLYSLVNPQVSRFYAIVSFAGFLSTLLAIPSEPSPYRSLLFTLHIIFAVISYATVFFGSFFSFFKILLEDKLKHKELSGFFMPIDTLMILERVFLNVALAAFTLTLIFGSVWSRSFLGKHWVNDPKLFSISLLWLYYAVLVHLNIVRAIRPRKLSQLSLMGGLFTLLNLIFVRHEL